MEVLLSFAAGLRLIQQRPLAIAGWWIFASALLGAGVATAVSLPTSFPVFGVNRELWWIYSLFPLSAILVSVPILSSAIIRTSLTPGGGAGLRFGLDELRVGVVQLIIGLVFVLVWLGISVPAMMLTEDAASPRTTNLELILILIPAFLLSGQFALSLPLAVDAHRISLIGGFKLAGSVRIQATLALLAADAMFALTAAAGITLTNMSNAWVRANPWRGSASLVFATLPSTLIVGLSIVLGLVLLICPAVSIYRRFHLQRAEDVF